MAFNGEVIYIVFHQVLFLISGLCTTLGTQWLFYQGAATGDSYLTQLAQYLGMILVGALIPSLLKSKQKQYQQLTQEEEVEVDEEEQQTRSENITMAQINHSSPTNNHHRNNIDEDDVENIVLPDNRDIPTSTYFINSENNTTHNIPKFEEGPIAHKSVMKLACMDIVANFCVTVGFAIVGSGMYQVIYSSVVIWCAILTWMFMSRSLSTLQWIAIFGTSAGLAISSMDNFGDAAASSNNPHATVLMFGTLMTLGGTFGYSCVYVYSDYMMSKFNPPPLPARICFYSGIYTSIISLVWIGLYTLPRFDQLIQIKAGVSTMTVIYMYILVTVSNACHSWNYYELIDRTGSVATGILQGLRAVLIYIISDRWYCRSDSAQCFTTYKGIGSVLVIGCVLLFTIGRNRSAGKHK